MIWPFTRRREVKRKSALEIPYGLLQARYDAAQTTAENRRHWRMSDAYSADAAATPEIRRILRNRSRYETANNSYAKGMVLTVAGDVIGTGPRLQLHLKDDGLSRAVERSFAEWSTEVNLAEKLRTMRIAKAVDGEAFAVLISNPMIRHPIKLDLVLLEAERVTSPAFDWERKTIIDGVELDTYGNPVFYHILKNHPGDRLGTTEEYEIVPKESAIHWFRMERPEQHRGIPELTPALPLFAQLRRYTLAVLASAETAADFAAVVYTDAPAGGEAQPGEPFDVVSLEKRMATTLPDGWKLGQLKAEQPTNTFPDFKREVLGEIGRCLQIPINVVTGDSSKHNYASGRLDHQTYHRFIRIEQTDCARAVMEPLFLAWIREYGLTAKNTGYFSGKKDEPISPCWFWDGFEHVDPSKEAAAQEKRLGNRTTTLAAEYAKLGKDWEEELRQIARERDLMKELGLTETPPVKKTKWAKPNDEEDSEEKEEE